MQGARLWTGGIAVHRLAKRHQTKATVAHPTVERRWKRGRGRRCARTFRSLREF